MKKQPLVIADDLPMESLILQCKEDKYKLAYATIRWAREIKQKESLPDTVQSIIPRALRELLTGKVSLENVEELPMAVKAVAPPPPPPQPTLTLNVSSEDASEPAPAE